MLFLHQSVVVLILMLAVVAHCFAEDPPLVTPNARGKSINADALEPGDIIVCTTKKDIISRAIRGTTNSPVSHAILFVGKVDGTPTVIEAVGGGVHKVSLESAIQDATLAVAFRHPNVDKPKVAKLLRYAEEQVGKPFSKWGIAREWLCRNAGVKCKISTTEKKWYCSELVLTAFKTAEMPIATLTAEYNNAPGDIVAGIDIFDTLKYIGHLKYTQ